MQYRPYFLLEGKHTTLIQEEQSAGFPQTVCISVRSALEGTAEHQQTAKTRDTRSRKNTNQISKNHHRFECMCAGGESTGRSIRHTSVNVRGCRDAALYRQAPASSQHFAADFRGCRQGFAQEREPCTGTSGECTRGRLWVAFTKQQGGGHTPLCNMGGDSTEGDRITDNKVLHTNTAGFIPSQRLASLVHTHFRRGQAAQARNHHRTGHTSDTYQAEPGKERPASLVP